MTAKSEYMVLLYSLKMTACLFDVLCESTETLNTQRMFASFLEIHFCFSSTLCQGESQSRVMIKCVLISNSFVKWLPVFYSRSKHDLKHTCTHTSTCTNHTTLMHKEKAKTFSLHVNTVAQTQIKACIQPQTQDGKVSLALSLRLMGRHSANQSRMSCKSVQSSTRTYSYILIHKHTYFSPGWQMSSLLIYRECWVWSTNMPEIFYTIITAHRGCWYEHSRI